MLKLKSNDELRAHAGTYLLVLRSGKTGEIKIGKLGSMVLLTGYYFYIGSAFGSGGVRARVNRHARTTTPLRWHIDYLKRHCTLEKAYLTYSSRKQESHWVERFLESQHFQIPLHGFGASDSHFPSHLFYNSKSLSDSRVELTLATSERVYILEYS